MVEQRRCTRRWPIMIIIVFGRGCYMEKREAPRMSSDWTLQKVFLEKIMKCYKIGGRWFLEKIAKAKEQAARGGFEDQFPWGFFRDIISSRNRHLFSFDGQANKFKAKFRTGLICKMPTFIRSSPPYPFSPLCQRKFDLNATSPLPAFLPGITTCSTTPTMY